MTNRKITVATVFYLVFPVVLFLLGWVRWELAIPLCAAIVMSCIQVCRAVPRQERVQGAAVYTGKELFVLGICLLGGLGVVELLGFHGHVMQPGDFPFRNAIYETLINQDWPIYSNTGDYFIYYHCFWLPPAFMVKCTGGLLSPATALFAWSYLGIALSILLLFRRLRAKTLTYLLILALMGSWLENLNLVYVQTAGESQGPASVLHTFLAWIGCGTNYRYGHAMANLVYCYNCAIPVFVLSSALIAKAFQPRHLLFVSSLIVCTSVLHAIALAPFLLLVLFLDRKEWRAYLNLPTFSAVLVLSCIGLYLAGQVGLPGKSELGPVWQYMEEFTARCCNPFFKLWWNRVIRVGIIFVAFFLPFAFILRKGLRRNVFYYAAVAIALFTSCLWIGRVANEFLWKGGFYVFLFVSLLLTLQWHASSWKLKAVIFLLVLVSSGHIWKDAARRHLLSYTLSEQQCKENYQNKWHGHLNHQGDYEYNNFFGRNIAPQILYSTPGEAMNSIMSPVRTRH